MLRVVHLTSQVELRKENIFIKQKRLPVYHLVPQFKSDAVLAYTCNVNEKFYSRTLPSFAR